MLTQLQLVWNNPRPQPCLRMGLSMLRFLADALAEEIRAGQIDAARGLAAIHHLSPLALAVVATRMSRHGITEEDVLRIV